MKFRRILFFLVPLLALTNSAFATVSDGTTITNEMLVPLADWVEQATHVAIKSLPITLASNVRLIIALNLRGVQRANAAAAYLPGQIIISNTIWDPSSVRMQSYVVHELVHHAQLLSRKKYPCSAAKEREAYTLQNRWLVEHGEEPLVTPEWIDKISSCSGNGDGS
jgi:hypothetical protein